MNVIRTAAGKLCNPIKVIAKYYVNEQWNTRAMQKLRIKKMKRKLKDNIKCYVLLKK